MPRSHSRRGLCSLTSIIATSVIVGSLLPLWHGLNGVLQEPYSSSSPVTPTDALLHKVVLAQNSTITKLASILEAIQYHNSSADLPSDLATFFSSHSLSSVPSQPLAAAQLPNGVSPQLAEKWCHAMHSAGQIPEVSIRTWRLFDCSRIVGVADSFKEQTPQAAASSSMSAPWSEQSEAYRTTPLSKGGLGVGLSSAAISIPSVAATVGKGSNDGLLAGGGGKARTGRRRPVPSNGHRGGGGASASSSGAASTSATYPRVFHGVNLVPPIHGLHADQDVTLRSMRRALTVAAATKSADVSVVAIELASDALEYPLPDLRPMFYRQPENETRFLRSKTLTRTVLDTPHVRLFVNDSIPQRPLPLVADILKALYDASEGAEYLVFTNADIGLQPSFYEFAVRAVKNRGAVAINRVEIPDVADPATGRKYGPMDLEEIFASASREPQKHHGFDCFVWRRELTPVVRLALGNLCVGYPPVGNVFVDALTCAAGKKFEVLRGEHQTFHLGVKNGGWGLYKDEYEGYNRLARKMAEATVVRLASLAVENGVGARTGGSYRDCVTSSSAPSSSSSSLPASPEVRCVRAMVGEDEQLLGHALGHGALTPHAANAAGFGAGRGGGAEKAAEGPGQYKRGAEHSVREACVFLSKHLPFAEASARAFDERGAQQLLITQLELANYE